MLDFEEKKKDLGLVYLFYQRVNSPYLEEKNLLMLENRNPTNLDLAQELDYIETSVTNTKDEKIMTQDFYFADLIPYKKILLGTIKNVLSFDIRMNNTGTIYITKINVSVIKKENKTVQILNTMENRVGASNNTVNFVNVSFQDFIPIDVPIEFLAPNELFGIRFEVYGNVSENDGTLRFKCTRGSADSYLMAYFEI